MISISTRILHLTSWVYWRIKQSDPVGWPAQKLPFQDGQISRANFAHRLALDIIEKQTHRPLQKVRPAGVNSLGKLHTVFYSWDNRNTNTALHFKRDTRRYLHLELDPFAPLCCSSFHVPLDITTRGYTYFPIFAMSSFWETAHLFNFKLVLGGMCVCVRVRMHERKWKRKERDREREREKKLPLGWNAVGVYMTLEM